ncbi:MAG: class I adenylate-forming enzyme family protein [Acidimicrobiales bacterium]|jgi:fatty-acyl-CoA synthase|nr:class I adenylate-forming enzyme family protein [Acidimicrobiales bacterium]MDP6902378.1 class I adenylate-forming enzyme family protein [Acidimicrobiales bacterium]HJL99182.1 class I adenylate-forming enzyme family protein [Acidimicrobiales bacterium]
MSDDWLLMGDVPKRAARLWKDDLALVFKGKRWTHGEFAADVEKVAKGLIAIGVGHGDHVAVWMTNRPEWLHLMYAIPRVGGCIVPLNTRYRTDDVAYTVVQSQSKFLIALDQSGPIDYGQMLVEARQQLDEGGHLETIVMLGEQLSDSVNWETMLEQGDTITAEELEERSSQVNVQDRMMLAYTSGTTGHPKGVIHCHKPIRNTYERAMLLGHNRNDVHMSYLPLFHAYGFSEVAMMVGLSGGSQILFDVFDPDEVLDAVQTERGTVLHGFDSHWADLIRVQQQHQRDVSSLRAGTLPAGMESTIPVARQVQELFCPTTSGFGMSESWAFIASSHITDSLEQRTEASGYPMYGIEFQIRDLDSGDVLGANETGALHVRGYTITSGYWDKPEATAEVLDSDGWLDTGDVALLRPDGHVVFIGRHKDMLKVGGENVSPAEVEGYLLEVDGVEEIAVVGYPDERLVEVPVAFVVRSNDVSAEDLLEKCQGRIASFKIPRHVIFIDEMPATPSGKIRKIELREWALNQIQ